jgi:hypothetical protein
VGVAENKALVLRFYTEVWGSGNVAYAHDVFADDYLRHDCDRRTHHRGRRARRGSPKTSGAHFLISSGVSISSWARPTS